MGNVRPVEPPTTVVVVAGGDDLDPGLISVVPDRAPVIAADSGVDHARRLGLRVTIVVGDLDSATVDGLAAARSGGAEVIAHPRDKDATDLELALHLAVALGPVGIVVLGGHGGRLDHHLANLLLLAAPGFSGVTITAWMGSARVTVIHRRTTLRGPLGSIVSLLPVHGAARGVTTGGLAFPLVEEDLPAGTSRGVSNRFDAPRADVDLRRGVLLAIQPDALEELS